MSKSVRTNAMRFVGVVTALVVLSGCGGDGTVPVRGTVTFADGKVPKGCRVFFQPLEVADEAANRPTFASVEEDGTYQAYAYKDANAEPTVAGLVPGRYQVKITYYDLRPGADPNFESSWTPSTKQLDELVVDVDTDVVEYDIEVAP